MAHRTKFVSEREPPKLHKKICRRCNEIFKGGRQARVCKKCFKFNKRNKK